MKHRITIAIAIMMSVGLLAACGGSKQKTLKERVLEEDDFEGSLVDSIVGDVKPVHVVEEKPEEAAAVPDMPADADKDVIGGSQGAFVAKVIVQGKEADATFRALTATAAPEVVMEGVKAGTEVRLDPGLYDFIFTTTSIAGSPQATLRGVEIEAGRRTRREVKYRVGQITLVTGERCQRNQIQIRAKGATDWIPGKFFTCEPIILEAGEYEARMGGARGIPISGIQVYDGGIRDILIRRQ